MSAGRVPGIVVNPNQSTFSQYLSLGLARSGISSDAAFFWDDFLLESSASLELGWLQVLIGSGAINNQVALRKGGVGRFTTGATANSHASAWSQGAFIGIHSTERWYLSFRMKVATAIDAAAKVCTGIYNIAQNRSIFAGVMGPSSTVNFGVQYDGDRGPGSFLSFGVAIDTNFHVYELYCQGDAVIRARIDGGAEVSAAITSPPTDTSLVRINTENGATAADRQQDIDWILGISGRNTP